MFGPKGNTPSVPKNVFLHFHLDEPRLLGDKDVEEVEDVTEGNGEKEQTESLDV